MKLQSIKTLATTALLVIAGSATAGETNFTMVSGVDHPGIDLSLSVQASSTPGYAYDFTVTNHGTAGIVTGVYFETGWNSMIWGAGLSTGPATLYPASLSPQIEGWEGSKVSHTIGTQTTKVFIGRGYREFTFDRLEDGIELGQSQTFSFNTDTEKVSLKDLLENVGTERFGIGVMVQDLASDRFAKGWGLANPIEVPQRSTEPGNPDVTGVPSPTAAFAGLAIMAIAGLRRRRA